MEDLIELYLFKNKKCPLPSLGVLEVMDATAVDSYTEGKIEAAIPVIKLQESALPVDDFIKFIAAKKNISSTEASALLTRYCNKLQNMDAYSETYLPHAGKFYVNADGSLVFKTIEISQSFLPGLQTVRIIHPDATHAMMVGDKETTTTEMAAYYAESGASAKDKWWIWAVCLAAIAVLVLVFYFNDKSHSDSFGNSQKTETAPVHDTYGVAE